MFSDQYVIKMRNINSQISRKAPNIQKLNIAILNLWKRDKMTKKIRKYFKMNNKEKTSKLM